MWRTFNSSGCRHRIHITEAIKEESIYSKTRLVNQLVPEFPRNVFNI